MGLAIAAVCADRGYHVCLFRMKDSGRPRADTLRNQGWLQSGLMYVGHYGPQNDPRREMGRTLATRMRIGGLAMLRQLGIPFPDENQFGVFRLADEEQLGKVLDDARSLRLNNVARLSNSQASALLGPVFAENSIYCSVPDLPFPEADVVRALRDWAIRERTEMYQVDAPIGLVASKKSDSGVIIEWDGNQMASKVTITAAGAGNCELLRGLGLDSMMELQQTPLLVVHDTLSISAPIFNDRVLGFSFVRHAEHPANLPKGALVIATRSQRIVPFAMPEDRRLEQRDIDVFARHIPAAFSPYMDAGRFTAGFEVLPRAELDRPYVAPWTHWCPEFPALMHAMPGRATLGLTVARDVLDQVVTRIGGPTGQRNNHFGSDRWHDDIHMHFHQQYDFNDWE